MATETESLSNVFEQVFQNFRKVTETNIELQQDMFRHWGANWPGFPQTENSWLERVQKFQKDWAKTFTDLVNKHRRVMDEEYRLAIDGLKEAFRAVESSDPQELRQRCEELCRKTLDLSREACELQAKETQDALNKWVALAAKGGT